MSNETELDDGKKNTQIVEYLQAPKKKRKHFIILALGKSFNRETASEVENHLRQTYKNSYALTMPKNPKELKRLFSRQIVLLVIDHAFAEHEETIELVKDLKTKNKANAIPVIFMTKNQHTLVEQYNRNLIAYQEVDSYINYRDYTMPQIVARLVVPAGNIARRSRRFNIDVKLKYYYLAKDRYLEGKMLNISVHGGVLQDSGNEIFKMYDQLKIHLPIAGYMSPKHGEFLRLSAKVRRVLIGGNQIGFSWEYLSEEKLLLLTEYVIELTNSNIMIELSKKKNDPRQKK